MKTMTWREVWVRRLSRHSLLRRAPRDRLVNTVGEVCGIHAQIISAAELSIGIRVEGVKPSDVQAVLWEERTLVKTFGIRGTVHLFPAHELSLWMAALRAKAMLDPKRYQSVGLDPGELRSVLDAIGEALDGQRLTLKQLGDEIVRRVGAWAGEVNSQAWGGTWPRWRKALGDAALEGVLVYGPPVGNEVTFVRPDQWTGYSHAEWHRTRPEEALAEVFRRYLRAYGPATTRDFAQWFTIPLDAARRLAVTLKDELEPVQVEGYPCFLLAGDNEEDVEVPDQLPVKLLPHFDCYVIGCHPRKRLLPPEWAARLSSRTTPSQLPTLLVDGMVAGIWEKEARKGKLEVRVEPFRALTNQQETLLEEEAARIGEILGLQASLTVGPVSIRPHL